MIKSPFYDSLIDDFGIWQHTDGSKPRRSEGYALDDAARGLIACLVLGRSDQAKVLLNYLVASRKGSDFYGFSTAERKFIKFPSSDDAKAQVVWALGRAIYQNFQADLAQGELNHILPSISNFKFVRGPAYALLGTVYFDPQLSRTLADQLAGQLDMSQEWIWPEDQMTYANGILPYSLLRYGLITRDQQFQELALKLLEFVETKSRTTGRPAPIGNQGWLDKDQSVAPVFSQQPIDAAYMVWANMAAYQLTNEARYKLRAKEWFSWFSGNNVAGKSLINPRNNQCYDGIDPEGINHDSGAESNICYLLSHYALESEQTF